MGTLNGLWLLVAQTNSYKRMPQLRNNAPPQCSTNKKEHNILFASDLSALFQSKMISAHHEKGKVFDIHLKYHASRMTTCHVISSFTFSHAALNYTSSYFCLAMETATIPAFLYKKIMACRC